MNLIFSKRVAGFPLTISSKAVIKAGILLALSGCAIVQNPPTTSASVDDLAIESLIQVRFGDSQELTAACIQVDSLYGVVLLSGVAQSAQQKLRAQMLAEQVTGVRAVHNELVVASEHNALPTSPNCRMTSSFGI